MVKDDISQEDMGKSSEAQEAEQTAAESPYDNVIVIPEEEGE